MRFTGLSHRGLPKDPDECKTYLSYHGQNCDIHSILDRNCTVGVKLALSFLLAPQPTKLFPHHRASRVHIEVDLHYTGRPLDDNHKSPPRWREANFTGNPYSTYSFDATFYVASDHHWAPKLVYSDVHDSYIGQVKKLLQMIIIVK